MQCLDRSSKQVKTKIKRLRKLSRKASAAKLKDLSLIPTKPHEGEK